MKRKKNRFKDLYQADMKRYERRPELYIVIFLYLYRRAITATFLPLKFLYKALFRLWANRRGLEFTAIDQIGKGLYIDHAYNITINQHARIGCNCNIHKGVVIGQANRGKLKGAPTIGNQVWIGINAAIVGRITVGDDVIIAPNSFVNVDIPSHSIVLGNPCVIKHRDWATEGYINSINIL